MMTSRSRECADDILDIAQGVATTDDKTAAINARIDGYFDALAEHLRGSPGQDGGREISALRDALTNASEMFARDRTPASDAISNLLEQAINYVEQKPRP
jgi:hypothetical protein